MHFRATLVRIPIFMGYRPIIRTRFNPQTMVFKAPQTALLKHIVRDPAIILSVVMLSASVFFYHGATELKSSILKFEVEHFTSEKMLTITQIVDGDEVSVESPQGSLAVVRLIGVKAFHRHSRDRLFGQYGRLSFEYLSRAWLQKKIRLKFDGKKIDSRGRLLAYMEFKDPKTEKVVDVGREMVRRGYAVVFTETSFRRESDYLDVEKRASLRRRGVWQSKGMSSRIRGLRALWAEKRGSRTK